MALIVPYVSRWHEISAEGSFGDYAPIRDWLLLPDVSQLEARAFFAHEARAVLTVHHRTAVADARTAAHLRLQQRLHRLATPGPLGALFLAQHVSQGHEHRV